MSSRIVAAALIIASFCVAALGWMRWRDALPLEPGAQRSTTTARRFSVVISDSALAEAEELIVENDPFRISNRPSSSRYDPSDVARGPGVAPTPIARPSFVLRAIVGGPPWQALVDGIPGQPAGSVVRVGDRFDRLVIRSVTRDSVVVQGPDTVWTLTFAGRS